MKPYQLYSIETFHQRHITTVSARSYDECRRKAWKAIFKKRPKMVPYFKDNPFLCINQGGGGDTRENLYGREW